MYLYKVSNGATSNEVDFYFEPSVEINNFVQPAPVPQRAGNLKRNKAAARAFNNQQEESDSSSKFYKTWDPIIYILYDGKL